MSIRTRDIEATLDAEEHAMAVFDKDGRMVRANRLFRELLSLDDHPEFQAASLRERVRRFDPRDAHGRRIPSARLPVARALRGDALVGAVGVDLHVRALDGRELDLYVSATPLWTRAGRVKGCVVVAHDQSETRRTTARLREVAARVAALSREVAARARERDAVLAAIADGVLLYSPDGRLLHANAAARALLGETSERSETSETAALAQVAARLASYTIYDAAGQQLPAEAGPLQRVLRGEMMVGGEAADAVRRLPDGSEQALGISAAPIQLDGRLAGAVLTLRNVTERRRLERAAAEHAGQIEGIFEAMADGLASYDAAGLPVRMNAAARHFLGDDALDERAVAPGEAWTGHPTIEDPSGRPLSPDAWPLKRILQGETLTGERAADVRTRRSDDTDGVLAVSGAPVLDNGGRVIGAVLSMRDVTAARRLDAERAQMMSTVSHELRTPVTIITMAAGQIERRAALGQPPTDETLGFLTDGVVQMTRLVNDLVDAARMEVGHLALEPVPRDLRTLCENVAGEQMRTMQRAVALRLPTQPAEVNADPIRISQVLANLLSNAFKYSPPDRPVILRLRRRRGMARVEVRDEGPGIPTDAKSHVFERFYRVPGIRVLYGSGVGLGLGLYIARTLIELHGGHIGVDSGVGNGSTFWFTLPLLANASS